MIDNLIICFNAVIPLTIYLIIGFIIRRVGLISEQEVHRFNRLVFVAFFPPMMFDNLYSADLKEAINPGLMAFSAVFILAIYTLTTIFICRIEKAPRNRGAMIQAIYRSNFVLMGLPIAINIFGKGNAATTAAMIMVVVPIYNVLAVITLEYFRGGKVNIGRVLLKILQNPIIIGAILGIAALITGIKVPLSVMNVVGGMSTATTPIALILLGASFDIKAIKAERRNVAICVIGRLLVVPAIGLTIAALLGIRGVAFVSLIVITAAPTAISSYTMAEAMDSNGELAGSAVIISTPLSCITLFLWLLLFKTLGMF